MEFCWSQSLRERNTPGRSSHAPESKHKINVIPRSMFVKAWKGFTREPGGGAEGRGRDGGRSSSLELLGNGSNVFLIFPRTSPHTHPNLKSFANQRHESQTFCKSATRISKLKHARPFFGHDQSIDWSVGVWVCRSHQALSGSCQTLTFQVAEGVGWGSEGSQRGVLMGWMGVGWGYFF